MRKNEWLKDEEDSDPWRNWSLLSPIIRGYQPE
jgi:hypothetical protein